MYNSNIVEKIIRFENGEMSFEEEIDFFQELVDTGLAWELQGTYGRIANDLIKQGFITVRKPKNV